MRFGAGDDLVGELVERDVRDYYAAFTRAFAQPGAALAYASLLSGVLLIADLCWSTHANLLPAWWKASESDASDRSALFGSLVMPIYTLVIGTLRDFRSPLPHELSPELAARLDSVVRTIREEVDEWRVPGPVVASDEGVAWAFDVIDIERFVKEIPVIVSRLLELAVVIAEQLSAARATEG
jgi:hypothetical protein